MYLNRDQIANALSTTGRTVTTWRDSEGMPAIREGRSWRYPLKECVTWLIDRRLAAAQGPEYAQQMAAAKLKTQQEQADKLQLQNQEKRNELIPIPLVAETFETYCKTVRAGCLGIPAELGRACPELSASGMDVVRRVIAKVLNGLSDRYAPDPATGE